MTQLASIEVNGFSWVLENEAMRIRITFTKGSLTWDSCFNKLAESEYVADPASGYLFYYLFDGHPLYANDGGWTLAGSMVTDIVAFDKHWGKQLVLEMSREIPVAISVKLVFEQYDGAAGLRYSTLIRNRDLYNVKTVSDADVIALPFVNDPHTIYFIAGRLVWSKTEGSLPWGRRNCITHYHDGHGWGLNLENNWATSIRSGAHKGDENHPFISIQAWHRSPLVKVITDPEAVQVMLFPDEEIEFFSVNFSVFQGDRIDGRMAAALHLRNRYKFHNPSRVLSTNDWRWALTDPPDPAKKNEQYYRDIVVPRALAAGFDNIHIDWQWNVNDDSVEPRPAFTSDAAAFADELHAQGLKVGFWFSLHGDNWGKGRDVADPANIAFKKRQLDETLATAYRSHWQQIDLGLLNKNEEVTPYSHPQDSVYRKVLGLRNYMNYATYRYPDMLMQTTCEIDNPGGLQNVGLSHLADNGIIGTYLRTESAHNVKDMFQSIGLFPLEGLLETWGEGGQKDGWQESAAWYYQFLLGRHTSIYSDPLHWTPRGIEQMRKFNEWRKNPRMQALLNEMVRPVYEGPRDDVRDIFVGAEDESNGPFVWMFTNDIKSYALLLAVLPTIQSLMRYCLPLAVSIRRWTTSRLVCDG